MSKVDRRLDGITVDNWEARFTGRIPLENEELEAATIDSTGVLVVVVHQDGYAAAVNKKTGDLTRTNVLKVTDARLVAGDLRSLLVEKLGLYGDDTVDPPIVKDAGVKDTQDELPFADHETGEIEPDAPAQAGGVEQIGHIKTNGTAPSGNGKPGVVPFRSDENIVAPSSGQVVGHINAHKDPALAGFLDEL